MHFFLIILVLTGFVDRSNGDDLLKRSHPEYYSVSNPYIPLTYDCPLRAFAIEMAGYIAPPVSKTNWTTLAQSAFQMHECNSSYSYQPSNSTKPFKSAPELNKGNCQRRIFVHDSQGNDFFDGTFEKPVKTIQTALSLTRNLRTTYGSDSTLCITIRGGTYYLGTNATSFSSQIGAIALTTNDSNLVIENYQDEHVVLSGGTLLQLQWSIHRKTTLGGTIMKAQIPTSVSLDEFNELYIDGVRAIVAKYPNGDPSTKGLYANDTGFSFDSQSWIPPINNGTVDIHVASPNRSGTSFPNYHVSLGGGASVFNPPLSFWGSHNVPRGVTVKNGALPNLSKWSRPSTGFVHAFHSGYWGSYVFEIASINSGENTVMFGRGGFQEARGSSEGGAFYVSNIFEELDSPNEWFLDKDTRTLYFMPNGSMPNRFVASQIPCIISVSGSNIGDPVRNVTIQGLMFTESSSTYLKDFMVPSGGDWSVHRGGTIYLTNTKDVSITRSLFTQLGSNGVAIIDYNAFTSVTLNEFVWLGDSAIILVGSTNGIDGYSVASQPTNTLIQSNLIHETGIYIKQSAPVLISVSRSVSIIGNLMFNIPRAAVNINDGFYGNHTISWNVIFNTVRETSDHGNINSWDRQPFLTDAVQPGVPSLWQHVTYIHHNTLFNNYRSVWPLDHDDGSCFFEDSYNFQIYGGKKNYLGHSKTDHHEIYVYSDANSGAFGSDACLGDTAPTRGSSGWNETWINNICTLYKTSQPYKIDNCDTGDLFVPYTANNTIYIPPGTQVKFPCKVHGVVQQLTLEQWQSYGLDLNSTVQIVPDVQTIIQWGRDMLQHAS